MNAFSKEWLLIPFLVAFVAFSPGKPLMGQEIKTFAYGSHERQKLDVLTPEKAQNAPVVIFIHGGGWIRGDKKNFHYVQRRLAQEQIVTVSANYRLCPEATFPDFIHDGADVVAWTAKNIADKGGNPTELYLMGHSSGAHTVAMLGLNERYLEKVGVERSSIKGVIPIAAPLMLKTSQVPQLALIFGNAKDDEMWPLAFIDGNEPPFLLLQGALDPLVQPIHSQVAETMIKAKGGRVSSHIFENHDHMTIISAFSKKFESKGDVVKPILKMIKAGQ